MVSSIGSGAHSAELHAPKMPPPPPVDEVLKLAEAARQGFITESDLVSAIVKISPEGMTLSRADAAALAKAAFKSLDGDQDGKVTQEEFMMGAGKVSPRSNALAQQAEATQGRPPPGAGPPAEPALANSPVPPPGSASGDEEPSAAEDASVDTYV